MVDSDGLRYSPNVEDYDPLCIPCHTKRDAREITHCPQGHEYTEANTMWCGSRGYRCRRCFYEYQSVRWRRNTGTIPRQRKARIASQRKRRAAQRDASLRAGRRQSRDAILDAAIAALSEGSAPTSARDLANHIGATYSSFEKHLARGVADGDPRAQLIKRSLPRRRRWVA
jgi:hypothetical protein